MKKLFAFLALFIAGFSAFQSVQAQVPCVATPNGTEFQVTSSMTHNSSTRYLVCQGQTLTYDTTSSFQIYFFVERGATLNLKGGQITNVYLMENATLNTDTNGHNAVWGPFIQICLYDSGLVNFIDTADATFPAFTNCPGLTFDYAAYPGGVSPCLTTSTPDVQASEKVSISPNPASGEIRLRGLNRNARISVFAGDGRKVEITFDEEYSSADVSHLSSGLYFLHGDNGNGVRFSYSFVKY